MGLGGYLTWTAVAREIRKKYGNNIKLMPVEQHGSFYKFLYEHKDIEVFKDNEDFCLSYNQGSLNDNMKTTARKTLLQKLFTGPTSILLHKYVSYIT
jgi:hypothetical protein